MSADKKRDIDWDEVVKKEARGIDDADFGEVQLTIGDTVKRCHLPCYSKSSI